MEEQKFYPIRAKVNVIGVFVSILMVFVGSYEIFFKVGTENSLFIYYLPIFLIGIIFLFLNLRAHFQKKSGIYLNSNELIIKSDFVSHEIKWKDIK